MNISYISGIKKNHSEKYEKREELYHNIGNIFSQTNPSLSGFQGLGRTGIDWGHAVGRSFTGGEKAEYYAKNISLAPARVILTSFISNNGGGIANFLYSMWLRDVPYELPNQKKYADEKLAFSRMMAEKYKSGVYMVPADANQRRLKAIGDYTKLNPNADSNTINKLFPLDKFLTAAQLEARNNSKKSFADLQKITKPLFEAFDKELDKKYPYNTRFLPTASNASMDKYRGIEWKWFWSLGGNPDDLNNAVKEGNGKSPRGKDANYMLNKAVNGGLSFKDLPLVIRGFVSAQAGDKFGLGDEGTYLFAINGTNRIGGPSAETIGAYATVILPILSFIGDEIRKYLAAAKAEEAKNNPNPNPPPKEDPNLVSGNTGVILLAAAGVGAYLILGKK
jgi:hypothetical protein